MALPEIDMNDDLEADDELPGDPDLEDESPEEDAGDVDPMFAADVSEALPDLDDNQVAALQRAILGLISNMGGGGMPPSGGAPAAPF